MEKTKSEETKMWRKFSNIIFFSIFPYGNDFLHGLGFKMNLQV